MIYGAILAGGIGKRMGLEIPKQFYKIGGKPILIHSIDAFLKVDEFDYIIIPSPHNYVKKTENIIAQYISKDLMKKLIVIEGGETRNDSILNSINFTDKKKDSIMVTHDAARIFVDTKLIKQSIYYCKDFVASSPVIPSVDVIFESIKKGELNNIPLRKNLFRAQTPQAFKIKRFIEIYNSLTSDEIKLLDEAMMLFFLRNENIFLFEGNESNFKITKPFDLKIAKSMFNEKKYY